jgi:hypothetical protein
MDPLDELIEEHRKVEAMLKALADSDPGPERADGRQAHGGASRQRGGRRDLPTTSPGSRGPHRRASMTKEQLQQAVSQA